MKRLVITSFLVLVALTGSITALAYTGSKGECEEKTGSCCKSKATVSAAAPACHGEAETAAASGEVKPCCKGKK